MRYGFYTPDLAMADVKEDFLLRVAFKEYSPEKDLMYWEFDRIFVNEDCVISS